MKTFQTSQIVSQLFSNETINNSKLSKETTNRKCSICKQTGHRRDKCPSLPEQNNKTCSICKLPGHRKETCSKLNQSSVTEIPNVLNDDISVQIQDDQRLFKTKEEYVREFNAQKNGPLYKQPWVKKKLNITTKN